MVKLADASDSKSDTFTGVRVQVPLPAPWNFRRKSKRNASQGDRHGGGSRLSGHAGEIPII